MPKKIFAQNANQRILIGQAKYLYKYLIRLKSIKDITLLIGVKIAITYGITLLSWEGTLSV